MYVTTRKYPVCKDVKETNRIAQAEVVPVMRTVAGFRSYVTVDTGNGTVATISMFDSKAAAENANQLPARSCCGPLSRICCPTCRRRPWAKYWMRRCSPRGHSDAAPAVSAACRLHRPSLTIRGSRT
jgi:hypothetical protein